jgi:hypothetical protein
VAFTGDLRSELEPAIAPKTGGQLCDGRSRYLERADPGQWNRLFMPKPYLVAVPADVVEKDGLHYHTAGEKYLRALAECSHVSAGHHSCALADAIDLEKLLERVDGVLITGATSNVHPPHYGAQADRTP